MNEEKYENSPLLHDHNHVKRQGTIYLAIS